MHELDSQVKLMQSQVGGVIITGYSSSDKALVGRLPLLGTFQTPALEQPGGGPVVRDAFFYRVNAPATGRKKPSDVTFYVSTSHIEVVIGDFRKTLFYSDPEK